MFVANINGKVIIVGLRSSRNKKREEESNRMHQLTRRLKTSIVESYYNMLLSINLVVYCKLIVISRTIYYYGQQIRP